MPRSLDIKLAAPRGFCAGVDRAIGIVEKVLEFKGTPLYVKHEIVHNPHVVNRLKAKGVIFVESISEIPENSTVIFSAHGVSPSVVAEAEKRNLHIIDATCPLVAKVHKEAARYFRKDMNLILIGHEDHVEVEGTKGFAPGKTRVVSDLKDVEKLNYAPDENLAYVTQTTLSIDDTKEIIEALKLKYPGIHGPSKDDICYATQNRQNAVREMCKSVDMMLIIGATNSSNTMRLVDLSRKNNIPAYLIEDKSKIRMEWFDGVNKVGVSSGASAPEDLVQDVIKHLSELFDTNVEELVTSVENTTFVMPSEVRKMADAISG